MKSFGFSFILIFFLSSFSTSAQEIQEPLVYHQFVDFQNAELLTLDPQSHRL